MIRVYPIVEGHGEVEAVRTLLSRIWVELLGRTGIEIMRPHRLPKSKITKPEELRRALELARRKISALDRTAAHNLVLVLFDADRDAPCVVAPRLAEELGNSHQLDVAIVMAKIEFESWFVGAADSLTEYLRLDEPAPENPEERRFGKGWVGNRMKIGTYSETIDQPRLTAAMDLQRARARCPSFDKLCRELESR